MRSIPLALTWEYFRHSRDALLLVLLMVIALPVLVCAGLATDGRPDPFRWEKGFGAVRFIWVFIQAGIWVAAFSSHVPANRLYALPVSTWMLSAGRLSLSMSSAVAAYLIAATITNLLCPVGWPELGPALFIATAMACAQAAVWWAGSSKVLQAISVSSVMVALACWIRMRFSIDILIQPNPQWGPITHDDLRIMGVSITLAIGVAHVGVNRERRGAAMTWPRLYDLITRVAELLRGFGTPPSGSAANVQCWYEWRRIGLQVQWALIGLLLLTLGFCLVGRQFSLETVMHSFIFMGFAAPVLAALIGLLILGSDGRAIGCEMKSFLATRPISDADFAAANLKTTFRLLAVTWGVWAAGLLFTTYLLYQISGESAVGYALRGIVPNARFILYQSPLLLAAHFAVLWTATSIPLCMSLSGHTRFFVALISAGCVSVAVLQSTSLVHPEGIWRFRTGIMWMIGFVCGSATIGAFVAARRKLLIGSRLVGIVACGWLAVAVALAWLRYWLLNRPVDLRPGWEGQFAAWSICLLGVAGLAFAPLAAAPLALAWNRHR